MTKESIQEFAVALTASPSEGEGTEAKRNKKTQLLSALLSATALGVFLEGCGAGGGTPDPVLPAPVSSVTGDGSASNPYLATAAAEIITGSTGADWVSYAESNEGVTVDLGADAASGGWAAGDTLSGINNLIGSEAVSGDVVDDTLTGNDDSNILRGGAGNDQLAGGAGADTLDGGAGVDTASYISSSLGVRVDLSRTEAQQDFDGTDDFAANNNEAVGDILTGIENIRGSNEADWLTGDDTSNDLQGGGGDDRLEGGAGADTYVFQSGDGTDTVTDDGGNIVFELIGDDDYTGATYTFTRPDATGEAVTLTVTKDGNMLNVIEFASDPSSDFTFYTGSVSSGNEIPTSELVVPPRVVGDGSASNPYLATDTAEIITGSTGADWVSYEESNEGVTVDLGADTASGGWAAGDTLSGINNLIGSEAVSGDVVDDTLTGNDDSNILRGGAGNDQLVGGAGEDSYLFGVGDGTDTVVDDGGNIVFEQGAEGNAYTGATYAFTRVDVAGEAVTLTVTKDGNTLNVIEFASDPSSDYTFYTRSGDTDSAIPASSLVVPPIVVGDGSENEPYLATVDADTFTGSGENDWVSYAESTDATGVSVDLSNDPATVSAGWAAGDRLTAINNVIGSEADDMLLGNSNVNTLRGGEGADTLAGGVGADTLDGGAGEDTASYLSSSLGIRIDLSRTGAQQDFETNTLGFAANNNEAVGDILIGIENIRGSNEADWLTGNGADNEINGGGGDDRLEGGAGEDSYVFGADDGTDILTDDGGNIVFEQGTDNDYAGAIYTFTRPDSSSEAVTLMVTKDGNTLNVIEFASDPSSDFTFYTRSGSTDSAIPASELVVPPIQDGSESNPFLATAGTDVISGSGNDGWVSYAGSNEGVTIDISLIPATASDGWAAEDKLTDIQNLIGSAFDDILTGDYYYTLEGGRGDDTLAKADTYVFNAGDGGDTITDNGGKIIFEQGTNNDYVGASYTFTYIEGNSGDLRLTVAKGSNTLNTIDFSEYSLPSPYTFYTRSGGSDTAIPESSFILPARPGDESNPYLATVNTDSFIGSGIYNWVSYAGSNEGVTIELSSDADATVSGGWAAEDSLDHNIDNLVGSRLVDRLTGDSDANSFKGGRGDDILKGGGGTDTYVFNRGDGTDTITDNGGRIVFEQGRNNNDYEGATYTFADIDGNVRLTVTKGGNTLNTIDFANYPLSSAYTFYTRSGGSDTAIPTSSLVIPVEQTGSAIHPYLATADADPFSGTGIYDWVSYANSNVGVTVDLSNNPATVSGGWAVGDTLNNINNLVGSDHVDTLSGDSDVNTLRGGAGNDILDGGGSRDILEGGTGQDDYIIGDRLDIIVSDPDGGRLLFKNADASTNVVLNRDGAGDVTVAAGTVKITIDDDGANDAYQHGSYSVHYGASDTFAFNIYVGRHLAADSLTGSNEKDALFGFSGKDNLYGQGGSDFLDAGDGNDLLVGGTGSDNLFGGGGSDTYRFNHGDGYDVIGGNGASDGGGNKLIFIAPYREYSFGVEGRGYGYSSSEFDFDRGNFVDGSFAENSRGDDLRIVISISVDNREYDSFGNLILQPPQYDIFGNRIPDFTTTTQNRVVIEDYFDQGNSAYTIYSSHDTGFGEDLLGNFIAGGWTDTIVSTQPAETS